jgi:ribosomal protein L11 methyltransferase
MWLQAHVTVEKDRAPLLELLLEQLGALSVTLEDAADEPMFEPPPGATPLWQATRVTGLFPGDTDADALRADLEHALAAGAAAQVALEVLEDRAWERAWLERFRPMRFGRRLWVCPSGQTVDAPDAVVVRLDPGLAFGTGTHPTTALCLEWLDGAELAGRRVIDFGCGSGILGIAAARLGAARVVALDHDPQALLATRANAAANAVAEQLETRHSSEPPPPAADIVIANILANVLLDLRRDLSALVLPGGQLVLSGILREQAPAVAAAYAEDFALEPPVARDEWVRLDGRRRS